MQDPFKRELDQIHQDIASIERKLDNGIVKEITDIKVGIARINTANYVTQDQFKPVSRMVWLQMTIWVGVVIAIFGWVINAGRIIK